eukprot:TRINITY_DN113369_c0_g1_i1.p1 TRINITY_DN113369_c0_g1~~TRINITY_DN113369_c0_g1_i1.p1  ORF type:complete len:173 (-),score=25.67 TRINITY_DN113369_c0_g1_i1:106-624(-)
MAKRGATKIEDRAHMAQPVPGPMTPSCGSDEEDEPIMAADVHMQNHPRVVVTMQDHKTQKKDSDTSSKKAKLSNEPDVVFGSPTQVYSLSSTATSTPLTSPSLSPSIMPFTVPPQVDYRSLSEAELRQQLGVAGTNMADDWKKEEMIAVLEELDRVVGPELKDLEMMSFLAI